MITTALSMRMMRRRVCACRWPHIVPRFRKVGFKRRNLQEEILQNRAVSVNELAHVLTWVDYVRLLTARKPLVLLVPVL